MARPRAVSYPVRRQLFNLAAVGFQFEIPRLFSRQRTITPINAPTIQPSPPEGRAGDQEPLAAAGFVELRSTGVSTRHTGWNPVPQCGTAAPMRRMPHGGERCGPPLLRLR